MDLFCRFYPATPKVDRINSAFCHSIWFDINLVAEGKGQAEGVGIKNSVHSVCYWKKKFNLFGPGF